MKTVKLQVEETLKYKREVIVLVPDEIDEDDLGDVIDRAIRRTDEIYGFISNLEAEGITLAEKVDDDLSSPDYMEIDCDDYEYQKGAEEKSA